MASQGRTVRDEIQQRRPFASVADEAVVTLLRTADVVRRRLLEVVETHGITLQQYNVLRILRGAGPEGLPWVQERAEGYCSAMREAGLEPLVRYCAFHTGTEEARACLRELLKAGSRVSAICTGAGDLTAVVLAVARDLDIRMPGDLALAGFDDHPYYEFLSPPVTAVSQPIFDLGRTALEILFLLMDGKEPEARGHILPTRLVVRGSCGTSPVSATATTA